MSFKRRQVENGGFKETDFSNDGKIIQRKGVSREVNKPNKEAFLSLVKKLQNEGDKFEENGLVMEFLEQRNFGRYFKMDYKGKSYFVKKLPRGNPAGGGAKEVTDVLEAKKDLSDIQGVEVIDYQLGYEDIDSTYVISSWNENIRGNDFSSILFGRSRVKLTENEYKKVYSRFKEVQDRLKYKYGDVTPNNVAYDPQTDKIVIYDL